MRVILRFSTSSDWCKSRNKNAIFLTELDKLIILTVRMNLDLIVHRLYLAIIENILQLTDVKVAHTDVLNLSLFKQLFHSLKQMKQTET